TPRTPRQRAGWPGTLLSLRPSHPVNRGGGVDQLSLTLRGIGNGFRNFRRASFCKAITRFCAAEQTSIFSETRATSAKRSRQNPGGYSVTTSGGGADSNHSWPCKQQASRFGALKRSRPPGLSKSSQLLVMPTGSATHPIVPT